MRGLSAVGGGMARCVLPMPHMRPWSGMVIGVAAFALPRAADARVVQSVTPVLPLF